MRCIAYIKTRQKAIPKASKPINITPNLLPTDLHPSANSTPHYHSRLARYTNALCTTSLLSSTCTPSLPTPYSRLTTTKLTLHLIPCLSPSPASTFIISSTLPYNILLINHARRIKTLSWRRPHEISARRRLAQPERYATRFDEEFLQDVDTLCRHDRYYRIR